MLASKENAEQALKELEKISQHVEVNGFKNEDDESSIDFINEFLTAAKAKLPKNSSYAKDKDRKKNYSLKYWGWCFRLPTRFLLPVRMGGSFSLRSNKNAKVLEQD